MRAQSSVEFLFFIGIATIIFAIFMWSNISLQNNFIGIKRNAEAKKLCDRIAFEINSAVRMGNGYKRKFYVDENLFGVSDFNISVVDYRVYIDWKKGSVSSSIITKNVSGEIKKGFNVIENKNGEIHVS